MQGIEASDYRAAIANRQTVPHWRFRLVGLFPFRMYAASLPLLLALLIVPDDLGVIAEVVASQSFVSEFHPSDNERLGSLPTFETSLV